MIEISQIRTDGGTQSRAKINEETVAEYAEAMADPNAVFPPAIVYYDGKEYWLADGFHRVAAWSRIGRVEVPADVRQGTRRDAILHSCAANSAHGLRRTSEDKRRAVLTLLEDEEWSHWSDREIARRCVVSPSTVAKYRAELDGVTVQMDSEPRTYTTKHGTEAQMNTANIGGGSKAGQESIAPAPQENMAETAISTNIGIAQSKADQETVASELEPDPDESSRQEFQSMTADGQEDDWIGLRREVDELRAERAAQKAEIETLKSRIKELSHENQGAVIGKLQKQLGAVKYERDEAKAATKRMEYRLKKAEARVAELEGMGIAL